eukprot:scaffold188319_cov18-Tisochrysis_lutea.AAC.3
MTDQSKGTSSGGRQRCVSELQKPYESHFNLMEQYVQEVLQVRAFGFSQACCGVSSVLFRYLQRAQCCAVNRVYERARSSVRATFQKLCKSPRVLSGCAAGALEELCRAGAGHRSAATAAQQVRLFVAASR